MQFLKSNKELLYAALILPFFFLYIDTDAIAWVKYLHTGSLFSLPHFRALISFLHFVTHGAIQISIALAICTAGKIFNRHLLYEAGGDMAKGFAVAGIAVQIMKHGIGRARPRVTDAVEFIGPTLKNSYDSFPSGHTTVTFCMAYILSRHFPRYSALFYLSAIITGLIRIIDTSHFPSDVVSGAVFGLILGRILMTRTFRLRAPASVGDAH